MTPIICRQASDPARSGSVKGYFCRSCGKELQVTATGVRQIQEGGGVPYCNGCGFQLIQKFKDQGFASSIDLVISEQAQEELRRRGLSDTLKGGTPVHTDDFLDALKRRAKAGR